MVETSCEKVLVHNLLRCKRIGSQVAASGQPRRRQVPKRKIGGSRWIYRHCSTHKLSRPRQCGGHAGLRGDALTLPQTLVICEKEGAVFQDRSANRTAKLIPLERSPRPRGIRIKVVPRVESTVPNKLVSTSVKAV